MRTILILLSTIILFYFVSCRPQDLHTPTISTPLTPNTSSSQVVLKPEDCRGMCLVGDKLFVSSVEGLFWTADLGANWTKVSGSGGLPNEGTTYLQAQNGVLLSGMSEGGAYISLDSGKTWQQSLDASYKTNTGYSPSLVFIQGDTIFLCARTRDNLTNMIMRSTNRGLDNSWVRVKEEIGTVTFQGFIRIETMMYAFGQSGQIYTSSIETGFDTWEHTNDIIGIRENYCPLLWGKDTVVMPTGKGIYISYDKCKTWKAENSGLPSSYINTVTANESRIFVSTGLDDGTFTGIYWRKNNTGSWSVFNANITIGTATGDNAHYVLTMLATKTHLFIGTHRDGVKIIELSKILPEAYPIPR